MFNRRSDDTIDITNTVEEEEYAPPEEEIEETTIEEDEPTESEYEPSPIDSVGDSEEPPSVSRRVIGRVPPQLRVRTHVEMQPRAPPREAPEMEYQVMRIPRKPSRSEMMKRAQNEAAYRLMVESEKTRMSKMVIQPRRQKITTSQKMLAVANSAAGTNRGKPLNICARTNGALFRKPNVSTPSSSPRRNATSNFNSMIHSIMPGKKGKSKSSKKKGFPILSF